MLLKAPGGRVAITFLLVILAASSSLVAADSVRAAVTIRVPQDHASIQAAVNAASPGDTIVVAPGTYFENVTIDTSLTLRAGTYDPANPRNNTVILDGAGETVVTIARGIVPGLTLTGLVIRNGNNGIEVQSPLTLAHSYLFGNRDNIDYVRGGGGIAADNVFERSVDDNIDLNHSNIALTIEDNEILQAGGDGIEMRLNDDTIAQTALVTIRRNEIVGSNQDGIQLIDYFEDTNRLIVIERNLIKNANLAGVGLVDNATSREDFRAASIREPIRVFHNTFVGNDHGISGGDNLIAINNIFQGHALALKNVDASSIASYNLFWDNTVDSQGSVIDAATTLRANPLLNASDRLGPGSPAIDAGTAHFEWRGEVVMDQPPSAYSGAAPDLGWLEHMSGSDPAPSISGFTPVSGPPGTSVTLDGSNFAGATEVRFGVAAESFSVDSDTRITAVVPLGATTGPIGVTGPNGTGTSASSFTVATPARITVVDFSFKPKTLQTGLGSVVQWLFQGASTHTATDSIGLGPGGAPLFDSGPRDAGGVYEFTFAAAGGYPYKSTLAEPTLMAGTVKIPVVITPTTGTVTTTFSVTWASQVMQGFGSSVQTRFRAQGSSTWTTWRNFGPVQTQPSSSFTPDRGAGTYQFRSAMRNGATGKSSLRSPPTSITVASG